MRDAYYTCTNISLQERRLWYPFGMDTNRAFADWFSLQLDRRGFSRSEFARLIGVNQASVSRWASGQTRPSPDGCEAIAVRLGIVPETVLAKAGYTTTLDIESREIEGQLEAIDRERFELQDRLDKLGREADQLMRLSIQVHRARSERERQQRIERWSRQIAAVVRPHDSDAVEAITDRIRQVLYDAERAGELSWTPHDPNVWSPGGSDEGQDADRAPRDRLQGDAEAVPPAENMEEV